MRDFFKWSVRCVSVGWFWVVVLLVLPNCSFNVPLGPPPNLNPGSAPRGSAIFCDIEKPFGRHCASDTEKAMGVRLAEAAVALNAGRPGGNIGLDDSPAGLARCAGEPEAVIFQGAFPEGYAVCVNCPQVVGTTAYKNTHAACIAKCEDFFGVTLADGTLIPENPPDPLVFDFCRDRAHASTNFPLDGCFADACSTAGQVRLDFVDPRRLPEPVVWRDPIGVSASGGSLTRTAAFTGFFDAGAASSAASIEESQVIWSGDGFVEFNATETNTTRLCGLSSGGLPDSDPTVAGLGYGLNLFSDGQISIFEKGVFAGIFGPYNPGDRFRVKVKDNFNGTATVSYARVAEPCDPGTPCNETVFFTSPIPGTYPFRVDSSFFTQGATLTDVRLVRIRQD